MYVTLTPAYGRDYTSADTALADYDAGKDFVLNSFDRPNTPINKSQCVAENFKVTIRYNNNRKTVTVK